MRKFLSFLKNLEKNVGKNIKVGISVSCVLFLSLLMGALFSVLVALDYEEKTVFNILTSFGMELNPLTVILFTIGITICYLFFGSTFLHVTCRLLGGKGSVRDSVNCMAISIVPLLLIGWIPLVNIFGFIYSLMLLNEGIRARHKLSIARSSICISILLLLAIIFVLFTKPTGLL